MNVRAMLLASCLVLLAPGVPPAAAAGLTDYTKNKNFDDLTPAEQTAAKAEARKRKLKVLRVCADPGNMPLSNDKSEGFQNKIAQLLARAMGGEASFFWRPYLERGLTRETFANNECDVLLDMPANSSTLLATNPIYRTTYVLAYRNDRGIDIKSLDDPKLKDLKIGVFQHSGMREALARRGLDGKLELHVISHMADLAPEEQPWRQVQKVIDGRLDVAAVWGPFAGWLKSMRNAPLVIEPVNLWEDQVPMEFDLAIGMRPNDVLLKYMLDLAIDESRTEIAKILADYGVPLVECSQCAAPGNLPSHGSYYQKLRGLGNVEDRFLKQAEPLRATDKATPDQIVTEARVEEWLAGGSDLEQELANAVLANDAPRVQWLLGKKADVNRPDKQGYPPIVTAARNRNSPLIAMLADNGADPNARDRDGFTALMHAINRNHVPSIEMLAKKGANLELASTGGITPLAMAIGDAKFYAAKALVDHGADVNAPSGFEAVTPLMAAATQITAQVRSKHIMQGPPPIDFAEDLIKRGAQVNAASKEGVTPLMVAAGHDNAPMIALLLRSGADPSLKSAEGRTALDIARKALNERAIGTLRFLANPPAENAPPPGSGATPN